MARGARGATGARAQSLAEKGSRDDIGSATVLHRPTVAACAWGQQTKACLVTKATAQVCKLGIERWSVTSENYGIGWGV